jgi:hypothetical protein
MAYTAASSARSATGFQRVVLGVQDAVCPSGTGGVSLLVSL